MTPSKKVTLLKKIAQASKGQYFLRVSEKDGNVFVGLAAKIDGLKTSCRKNSEQIWLPCARLCGTKKNIKQFISQLKREHETTDDLLMILEYDFTHPFDLKTIESEVERDEFGFTESDEIVKVGRISYKELYETEVHEVKEGKQVARIRRQEMMPRIEDLDMIIRELQNNPGSFDLVNAKGCTSLKYNFNVQQKRPPSTDIHKRVKIAQANSTFLNVTKLDSGGNGSRLVTTMPRACVVFPNKPELENVFFTLPKDPSEESTGAVNFLLAFYKRKDKEVSRDAAMREVAHAIDAAPKNETSVAKPKKTKIPTHVFEKNDLPLEPTSPRNNVKYSTPDF